MELTRFDALARRWADTGTRRRLLGMLAGAGAVSVAMLPELGESPDAEGKARRVRGEHNIRGKKAVMCIDGKTRRVPKKKRKTWLKRGATRGACTGCTPTCPANGCGMDDGCGNVCGCGAGSGCFAGTCQPCSVSCTGTPQACGAALQAAIDGGGDLYVCPGQYASTSGFTTTLGIGVNLYGVGSGTDPASNTILDASGGTSTVLTILKVPVGTPVTLSGLRITGGNGGNLSGGIFNYAELTVENCAIVNNTSSGSSAAAIVSGGGLTLVNSLVEANMCTGYGAGGVELALSGTGEDSFITNSVITRNTGGFIGGVQVNLFDGSRSLTVDSTSQITNNTATEPIPIAGGIARTTPSGMVNVTGATISGNTDPQCLDVMGCL